MLSQNETFLLSIFFFVKTSCFKNTYNIIREDLCYLKSGRGYIRNRTDGFVSGATFRDGCNEDPYCDRPYAFYGHQCLLFSNDYWDASLADVRRNINNSRGVKCNPLIIRD